MCHSILFLNFSNNSIFFINSSHCLVKGSRTFRQIIISFCNFILLFLTFASSPLAERHGLKEPHRVEQLQMKIISSLRDHVTYNNEAQKKRHYFSRVLTQLPELRTLSVHGIQRIFYLRLEDLVPAPPLVENIFTTSLPF